MPEFVKLCSVNDVPQNGAKAFVAKGKRIAVFNVGGKFYAIGAVCTHAGGPLEEGYVEGEEVECPWHGSKFSLKTGKVDNQPATQPVEKFELKVQGSDLLVKI